MIAAILLVAFAVAVGGIISAWMTSFTRTTTGTVSSLTENQTKCAGVYIAIDAVTNSAIIFHNPSAEPLSNIYVYAGDGTTVASGLSLSAGASHSVPWTAGSNTSVYITGTCRNIGVSGSCERGQDCWKVS